MVNTNQMAEKIKDMTETQMYSIQKQIDELNEKTTILPIQANAIWQLRKKWKAQYRKPHR